jgi:hypothetical protein
MNGTKKIMYEMEKMRPGVGKGENDGGSEFNYDILYELL